jgi:Fur family ferric uptake transcriptional regulator
MLAASQCALSEHDLEVELDDNCDRTTIYRTLNTFFDEQIVHKLVDIDGTTRYIYNEKKYALPEHVHFKCNDCGMISCLESLSVEHLHLPTGYTKTAANFLVVGTCNDCNITCTSPTSNDN